ncbi:tyrosine-protein phosphatase [Comamonas testosteroni]|uniref:Tyrosine-protein phosphatase n=1 Tax=Comamonas testosteroni TaxID=285 RepID=A0A373FSQ6_COMTE|nr:tyrosine-protein phosphatase [Comamonas testosteroni]RGE46439.1 tyrosine-protein phosphatase [Comamonas testosteroni]
MNANDDLMSATSQHSQPERPIALEGASNFRDLGGYQGLDGRSLQWRKLYRSAHLAHLTQEDLAQLQALGVSRSADFRGVGESAHLAYQWPSIDRHALVVEPTVVQRAQSMMDKGQTLTARDTEALMHDTYRSFVNVYGQRFAQFFELLQSSDDPLVFHCTAGKDRTGWAAALLLTALGVDEEQIMEDYLLTNQYFKRPALSALGHMPDDALDALWRVQPSYLMASVEVVRAQHGSVDNYLTQVLGVDSAARERLASLYLTE